MLESDQEIQSSPSVESVPHVELEALPSAQKHPLMKKAVGLLKNVAESDITVLLSGESGVGKEIFAQTLHEKSKRAPYPFVGLNCASVPESLLEAELFGCEKGAYTGSVGQRIGKFELAQRGTLLLDEVSEMNVLLQSKLLRVIQEKEMYRIGGERRISLDVRIVATTNRDLREWVRKGNFREDLFYRLNVIAIQVPPLRERPEDIPVIANHVVERFNRNIGEQRYTLSGEAMDQLVKHPWPGNIRELENVLTRTLFLTNGSVVSKIHFDEQEKIMLEDIASPTMPIGKLMTLQEMERHMIRQALERHLGNRTHAAATLGISVRTLRNKLKLYRELEAALPENKIT